MLTHAFGVSSFNAFFFGIMFIEGFNALVNRFATTTLHQCTCCHRLDYLPNDATCHLKRDPVFSTFCLRFFMPF
jgi:hypothetical protein